MTMRLDKTTNNIPQSPDDGRGGIAAADVLNEGQLQEIESTFLANPALAHVFENAAACFVRNPDTQMIVSGGEEYSDTPRMRSLVRVGDSIRNSLSSPENGFVRLWRGNRTDEIGKNPSFTNSLEGIALPFLLQYKGKLSYVDVPQADLSKYVINVASAPDSEFILPAELAMRAVVVEMPTYKPSTQAMRLYQRYRKGGGMDDLSKATEWTRALEKDF